MKKILITLALLMSFAGSVAASLSTTYVAVPSLGGTPQTVNVATLTGDVIVMTAATNKKPSVEVVTFTSTAGAFAEFNATSVEGSALDVTDSYMAYLTISADGSYDFTATGVPGTITANIALYLLRAGSGDVRHLDTKANAWEKVVQDDPIGGTDALSWASNGEYGEISVIGAGSSTKGDLATTSLVLDRTDSNGVKRLLGHQAPISKGAVSYDVVWTGTSQAGGGKDHGTTISMAFAEFGTVVVPTYSIGGTISGLDGSVTLRNNNGDDLTRTADGGFTFSTEMDSGATYDVTVSSQPATQECTVANGTGTATADVTDITVSCVDLPTYSIGGTVSGLSGSVTLQNNGGDDLTMTADGGFTFTEELLGGETYLVTVSSQPATQECTVSNGSGTVSADVTDVAVTCVGVDKYSIGGNVSGLSGSVTLQNNGGDDLTMTADGVFTFATQIVSGETYLVTVSSQPATQDCTVSDGSGTATADVDNVAVTCVDVPTYGIGGNISGLTSDVRLQNNGSDNLEIGADGPFTFGTELKSGDTYRVTVATQPEGQRCTVTSGGTGTVSDADVINVVVECVESAPAGPAVPIPTMSQWALILLSTLLGLVAFTQRRRLSFKASGNQK